MSSSIIVFESEAVSPSLKFMIDNPQISQISQRGFPPQPNVTLAPEEPNVYRSNYESKTCAPAERDVSGNGTRHRLTFRSSGARRNLLEVARSINITSLRDKGNRLENLVKKQEVRPLYYRARLRDHESNTGGSPKTSAVRP